MFKEGLRGPQHPPIEYHQVLLSRNLIREPLQEVCRGSTGCLRFSTRCLEFSTGCSEMGFLVEEWRGKSEGVSVKVG